MWLKRSYDRTSAPPQYYIDQYLKFISAWLTEEDTVNENRMEWNKQNFEDNEKLIGEMVDHINDLDEKIEALQDEDQINKQCLTDISDYMMELQNKPFDKMTKKQLIKLIETVGDDVYDLLKRNG